MGENIVNISSNDILATLLWKNKSLMPNVKEIKRNLNNMLGRPITRYMSGLNVVLTVPSQEKSVSFLHYRRR